jgi:hypothetical protein
LDNRAIHSRPVKQDYIIKGSYHVWRAAARAEGIHDRGRAEELFEGGGIAGRFAFGQTVRSFEEALGIRVLHRTTRSVSLTEAGQRLLDRIRPAASELETALQDAKLASERPSGVVRIKSPKLAFQPTSRAASRDSARSIRTSSWT